MHRTHECEHFVSQLHPDPVSPIEERGGINLYGFVGNDPVNHWDYLGLESFTLLFTTAIRPPDVEDGEKSSHKITFNEYGKIIDHWEKIGITPSTPPFGNPSEGAGTITPATVSGTHPHFTVSFKASVYAKPIAAIQKIAAIYTLGGSGLIVGPLIIDYDLTVEIDACARKARIKGRHDGYPSYTLRFGGRGKVYDHKQSGSLFDLEPPMEISVDKEFDF